MTTALFCSFLMYLIIKHCSTFSLLCQQNSKVLVIIRFGMPDFLNLSSSSYTSVKLCLFLSDSGWNCKHQHQQDLWSVLIISITKCWYKIYKILIKKLISQLQQIPLPFYLSRLQSFVKAKTIIPTLLFSRHIFIPFFPHCAAAASSDLSLTPYTHSVCSDLLHPEYSM